MTKRLMRHLHPSFATGHPANVLNMKFTDAKEQLATAGYRAAKPRSGDYLDQWRFANKEANTGVLLDVGPDLRVVGVFTYPLRSTVSA